MKTRLLFVALLSAGLCCAPKSGQAQRTLKTDPTGNPLSVLNLGGTNVTGTLAAARLPGNLAPPVVLTISQTEGDLTLAAGTSVVVLSAPLTGPLNLWLPPSNAYAAGRALVIVDPGSYSSEGAPAMAYPGEGNLLNADTQALTILTGTGTASLQPDGETGWSTGLSYLRIPSLAGMTLAGPATEGSETLFSVRNNNSLEAFYVRGDGTAGALNLRLDGTLTSDAGNFTSDGDGGVAVENILAADTVAAPTFVLFSLPGDRTEPALPGRVSLYYHTDGKLHVRTPGGTSHTLVWTTP